MGHLTAGEQRNAALESPTSDDGENSSKPLLFIHRCEGAQVSTSAEFCKVLVENCRDTTVVLRHAVSTGALDLIRCENVRVLVDPAADLPTIVLDRSSGCSLWLRQLPADVQHRVYTSGTSSECSVVIADEDGTTSTYRIDHTQEGEEEEQPQNEGERNQEANEYDTRLDT